MIRVIYEWRVAPENVHAFNESWKQTSATVREVYKGDHGSCLLRDEVRGNTF
ncbi:hypothetical protein [Marinomonas posidonica]|uniref:Uncharacterized protein n=1 Tax=Marinomonas posidonica (strain CECT 7376 / NCIMB 14433 / IVIA-Po-181) TaxID=491952 RepID=F6CSJ1_MARPP|nr:hypothetical protein [Marinomonas posidonica]AEF56149.1 hypothetical protein Mar181_3124 [Marinomonas posidonica IVIA-Po-181]